MPLLYSHLRLLRIYDCTLPIEIWRSSSHDGHLTEAQIAAFAAINATVHDVDQYIPQHPVLQQAIVGQGPGHKFFVFKHLAILASRCAECLFLDSDNLAVRDVTFLFDDRYYKETGMVLWPDYWYFPPGKTDLRQIFKLAESGPEMQDYRTVESGQLLVDKGRSWASLMMAFYLQVQEQFWQPLVGEEAMGRKNLCLLFSSPFIIYHRQDDTAAPIWWFG